MKTILIAALALALAGCTAEDWQGGGNNQAALLMLGMGMQGYGNAQGARAAQAQTMMRPTTCMPINAYAGGGGFSCY